MGETEGAGVRVLLGPRKSGKSYAARFLAHRFPRLIVLDPIWNMGPRPAEPWWGAPAVVTVEELADRVLSGEPGRWRVCSGAREEGDDVADVALALRGGAFLADEADLWLDAHPAESWVELVERGRHYGVELFLTTRRPYLIWRATTANAETLYQYRCWEGRDVAWWKATAGTRAAELVAALQPFEAVTFNGPTGGLGRFRAPGRVVVPASAESEPASWEEKAVEREDDEAARDEVGDDVEDAEEVA